LIGALTWTNIIGSSAVHHQCCWNLVNAIDFIGDMSSHDVSNQKAKKCSIDGVKEIIGCDIRAFSV